MADRTIGDLPAVSVINPGDLLLVEQNGEAMSLTGELLTQFIDRSMVGVTVNIVPSTQQGGGSYNTQTGVLTLNIPKGTGVSGLSLVSSEDAVDTYRLSYEDGSYNTLTVTNGLSVQSIVKVGSSGLTDTYNVVLNDGSVVGSFTVTNGSGGVDSVGGVAPDSNGDVPFDSLMDLVRPALRTRAQNVTFTPTWVSTGDATYPYYCDVPLTGINANWFAEVVFSNEDAISGDFAPTCQTRGDVVRIACVNNTRTSITIPTIYAWR